MAFATTGGRLPLTVTVNVVDAVPPLLSLAVTVIVVLPAATGDTVNMLPVMLAVVMFVALELAV
jgi:hypothetical protein